jgi:transposase
MDTSKHFFQLHGVNAAEDVVLRKKMRRKEMVAFFKALAPTVIGIEACGASHHWARLLRSFGHEVKLIAAQMVKPYVKRGKNDAADAEALCEAMSRPTMRFVPVKTAEQQAALMMVGLRDRLIRNCTQLSNAIRSYAAEFGFTAAKGKAHLDPLLERIQADESVPVLARELFAAHAEEYARIQAKIDEVDAKLMAWHKADESSRRLVKIPGVGPIGAATRAISIGPTVCGMDRLDAKGSFDGRQGQARRHHACRRRDLAQRVGGWGHRRNPTCSTQRTRVALDPQPSQAQTAEVGRRGAGQQDGPRRLEADGHRSALRRQIRARRSSERDLEISQTRGAT